MLFSYMLLMSVHAVPTALLYLCVIGEIKRQSCGAPGPACGHFAHCTKLSEECIVYEEETHATAGLMQQKVQRKPFHTTGESR